MSWSNRKYRSFDIARASNTQHKLSTYHLLDERGCVRTFSLSNDTQERNNKMKRPPSHAEQAPMPTALKFQRTSLSACIILAPLSITLYILAWPENPQPVVLNSTMAGPIVTSTMADPTGNTLHFI